MTCFVSSKSNLRCQLIAQSLRSVKQNVHLDGEVKDRWVKFPRDVSPELQKTRCSTFQRIMKG